MDATLKTTCGKYKKVLAAKLEAVDKAAWAVGQAAGADMLEMSARIMLLEELWEVPIGTRVENLAGVVIVVCGVLFPEGEVSWGRPTVLHKGDTNLGVKSTTGWRHIDSTQDARVVKHSFDTMEYMGGLDTTGT